MTVCLIVDCSDCLGIKHICSTRPAELMGSCLRNKSCDMSGNSGLCNQSDNRLGGLSGDLPELVEKMTAMVHKAHKQRLRLQLACGSVVLIADPSHHATGDVVGLRWGLS